MEHLINFDLDLRRSEDGYVVQVLNSEFGEPSHSFSFPFTQEEEEAFSPAPLSGDRGLQLIGHTRPQTLLTPQDIGKRLSETLLNSSVAEVLAKTQEAARSQGAGVRIRLRMGEDVPELARLSWEYLCDPQGNFLALSSQTPLVRYIRLEQAQPMDPVPPPLRVLAVVSDPDDVPRLDVEKEYDHLVQALDTVSSHQVILERLPDTTVDALSERLRQDDIHALHFIGHGYFDSDRQDRPKGGLVFEREGKADFVDADQLRIVLEDRTSLRLVVLNACEGARSDPGNLFTGIAQLIIRSNVPIVLAMQKPITDGAAIEFAREFYPAIAAGYPVDVATTGARRKMMAVGYEDEWAAPALFSRLDDNKLVAATPIRTLVDAIAAEVQERIGDYFPLTVDVIQTNQHHQADALDRLGAALVAGSDALEILFELTMSLEHRTQEATPHLILLEGGYGTNKTTQLLRLVARITNSELERDGLPEHLPIYLDLKADLKLLDSNFIASKADLVALVKAKIDTYVPELTLAELETALLDEQIRLVLIFDHVNTLPAWERLEFFRHFQDLILSFPSNEYLLPIEPGMLTEESFEELHPHHLRVQRLAPQRIRHFLHCIPRTGDQLLHHLYRTQILGLASNPGILIKLLQDFQRGRKPVSRCQVMEWILRDHIATFPTGLGMRFHAQQVLLKVAWTMHANRQLSMPIPTLFTYMEEIRGHRGYGLEEMYDALQTSGILIISGDGRFSFAQREMQAYCAAKALVTQPMWGAILNDIFAEFGRATRVRWWQSTLVYLSGLLKDKSDELGDLLAELTFGANLLHSEQAFLAAQCVLEAKRQGYRKNLLESLAQQISEALAWRLYNNHNSDATRRARAARVLAQMITVFPSSRLGAVLVDVAYGQPRQDWTGKTTFELSSVRLAAVIGLLQIDADTRKTLLKGSPPVLIKLLEHWQNRDVSSLVHALDNGEEGTQGLAALALGEVSAQIRAMSNAGQANAADAHKALQALLHVFESFDTKADSLVWAVAHALTYLDQGELRLVLLDGFLAKANKYKRKPLRREYGQYRCIAYLIGRQGIHTQDARDFLMKVCLRRATDIQLWRITIETLGWLSEPAFKSTLERIATGDFSDLAEHRHLQNPRVIQTLQVKAIQALAAVGDRDTDQRLRTYLSQQSDPTLLWESPINDAYYQTSEAIHWRLRKQQSYLRSDQTNTVSKW